MEVAPCCCAVWFLAIGVLALIARELFSPRKPRPVPQEHSPENDSAQPRPLPRSDSIRCASAE